MDPDIQNQSVQTETLAQQTSFPKKSNKKIVFWIFAMLLFLIAFVAGGFFTGAKQKKPTSQNQQEQATPTPDPAANWETYTNTVDNYSFKYPSGWIVKSENVQGNSIMKMTTLESLDFSIAEPSIGGGYIPGAKSGSKFVIQVSHNDSFQTYQQLKDFNENIFTGFPLNFFTNKTEITANGVVAMSHTGGKPYKGFLDWIYFFNKGTIFDIFLTSAASSDQLANKIFSTFKFTDQNQEKVSVPTPTVVIEVSPKMESTGIFSGKYCDFDYRNYLSKKNDAEVFFNFCEKNIPKIANELGVNLNGRKTTLTFSETGFAGTSGDAISFLSSWDPNSPGFILHEGTHFVQNYGNKAENRGWVTEGLADLVRFSLTKASDEPGWAIGCMGDQTYKFGYGCAAAFFMWMEGYCGKSDIQVNLNRMILDGIDTNATFNNLCGKDVDELWGIYKTTNPPERIYPQT